MRHFIDVENVKCGGCASTIGREIRKIDGVEDVNIDIERGRISIDAPKDARATLVAALRDCGYPEVGSTDGLDSVAARAKSFVSCAIGKMRQ